MFQSRKMTGTFFYPLSCHNGLILQVYVLILVYNLIYICESTFDLSEVNIGILVSFQDSFKADVFFEKRSP